MLRFLPYVLKSLWGHRIRTALTLSGAAVALFVYYMVATIQGGLDGLKHQADTTLIVFQANKFCPATSLLPENYAEKIRKSQQGAIKDVLPIRVFTNNCRASLDVIVFYGAPAERLRDFRDFDLPAASWEKFQKDRSAALVGRQVAARRGLAPGSKLSVGDITITVADVFTSADRSEENYIYTHLEFLQRRGGKDRSGEVTQFEVKLQDSADPKQVAAAIDALFRGGPAATDTRTKGVFQTASLSDLFELIDLARYLAYVCVGLMVVLVATTSLMSVQDRIREHAVLQTIGFAPWRVFLLVLAESLILSAAGALVGIGAAVLLLTWYPLSIAAEGVALSFAPSLPLAAAGLLLALVIGVVAGALPGWQAARTEIVPALRV